MHDAPTLASCISPGTMHQPWHHAPALAPCTSPGTMHQPWHHASTLAPCINPSARTAGAGVTQRERRHTRQRSWTRCWWPWLHRPRAGPPSNKDTHTDTGMPHRHRHVTQTQTCHTGTGMSHRHRHENDAHMAAWSSHHGQQKALYKINILSSFLPSFPK